MAMNLLKRKKNKTTEHPYGTIWQTKNDNTETRISSVGTTFYHAGLISAESWALSEELELINKTKQFRELVESAVSISEQYAALPPDLAHTKSSCIELIQQNFPKFSETLLNPCNDGNRQKVICCVDTLQHYPYPTAAFMLVGINSPIRYISVDPIADDISKAVPEILGSTKTADDTSRTRTGRLWRFQPAHNRRHTQDSASI